MWLYPQQGADVCDDYFRGQEYRGGTYRHGDDRTAMALTAGHVCVVTTTGQWHALSHVLRQQSRGQGLSAVAVCRGAWISSYYWRCRVADSPHYVIDDATRHGPKSRNTHWSTACSKRTSLLRLPPPSVEKVIYARLLIAQSQLLKSNATKTDAGRWTFTWAGISVGGAVSLYNH